MYKIKNILKDTFKYIFQRVTWILKFLFPQELKIERLQIAIPYLDAPLRLVQISDIHYDHEPIRIDDAFLSKVIEAVNNQNPDLIVITGDLVQFKPEPIDNLISKHLSKLKAKIGIYSILGNHDYKTTHGPETIMTALKNSGIKVLHNETAYPMGKEEGRLQLVGLGDYGRKRVNFRLDMVRDDLAEERRARVVLSHNPDSAFDLEPYPIDLVLSGHTHGGGLATHPPLRLFCDPEITVIDLIPKSIDNNSTN
ncbi:hypothetical protein PPL_04150 [Heterostelium album PN500]|uniref:Calcineurin-like phosphoesterase domain-containing protein n=1 Tax=Heterostelium pallidum (strain ATCC 26659 / Pp 5 / PN500) TaxID=670386 RepID=D3B659_HETP5|nr:hypothetical protein PPL_04150 [Heterostelium album PN500]EFA83357.1 hypothetical protein PPL_04150 [Heterostelium album PN500]|eukprot:XP_020435474.1 hypothetical protein PPL_04150 [Heterostelium album PN500]